MTLPPRSLAAYELMAMPSVSDEQLQAIVERHGLHLDGPVVQMASSGVVHSLWSLGSRWVLRVPKNEPMCLGDHRCEAVAIPLALQAGVRTPALEVFDESLSILEVPYSIVDRIEGSDLGGETFGHSAFEDVGRELAQLHSADLTAFRHEWLKDPSDQPAEAYFEEVLGAGLLHTGAVEWLQQLCSGLDAIIDSGMPPPEALIHDDVKPDNVMVDSSGLTHLIDWGDAGFGDPAYDFQSLPMEAVATVLRGYRAVRQEDPTLEARIVRRIVARSLSNLRRTPLGGPSWYRPVAANLFDLLTFAADHPRLWRAWTQLP